MMAEQKQVGPEQPVGIEERGVALDANGNSVGPGFAVVTFAVIVGGENPDQKQVGSYIHAAHHGKVEFSYATFNSMMQHHAQAGAAPPAKAATFLINEVRVRVACGAPNVNVLRVGVPQGPWHHKEGERINGHYHQSTLVGTWGTGQLIYLAGFTPPSIDCARLTWVKPNNELHADAPPSAVGQIVAASTKRNVHSLRVHADQPIVIEIVPHSPHEKDKVVLHISMLVRADDANGVHIAPAPGMPTKFNDETRPEDDVGEVNGMLIQHEMGFPPMWGKNGHYGAAAKPRRAAERR